jgi:hypothetical protein
VSSAWHEESIREENEYAENDEVFINQKSKLTSNQNTSLP